jgi:hypothetical protein
MFLQLPTLTQRENHRIYHLEPTSSGLATGATSRWRKWSKDLAFAYICICLHIHIRTCSSFSGNFQVNVIIATFGLSWIEFALLTFLLTHPHSLRPWFWFHDCVWIPWQGQFLSECRNPECQWRDGRESQQPGQPLLDLSLHNTPQQLLCHICQVCARITTTLIGHSLQVTHFSHCEDSSATLKTLQAQIWWQNMSIAWIYAVKLQTTDPFRSFFSSLQYPKSSHLSHRISFSSYLAHSQFFPIAF